MTLLAEVSNTTDVCCFNSTLYYLFIAYTYSLPIHYGNALCSGTVPHCHAAEACFFCPKGNMRSPFLPFPRVARSWCCRCVPLHLTSAQVHGGRGAPEKGRLTWLSREAEQHQEYVSAAANSCRKPQKCTLYCFIISSLLIIS